MANVKISQLPEYTGSTSGSWLIMNNSGETTTYKVKKENIVPAGGGLFAQTGSFWNTTNNIGITGSLVASGSSHRIVGNTALTGSFRTTGSVQVKGVFNDISATSGNYINSNVLGGGYNLIEARMGYNQISASYNIIQGDNRLTGSLISSGSSHIFIGPTQITGSVNLTNKLNLAAQNPLPAGVLGDLAVSSSNALYFHNGTSWNLIS